jgi:hypothetical protein
MELKIDDITLFKLSLMGVAIDSSVYESNPRLEFASKRVYEIEIDQIETVIAWIKNLGCDTVIIGRGLRNHMSQESLSELITRYEMNTAGPAAFGKLTKEMTMLLQHTSTIDLRGMFAGQISKTVVLKNSRPIEVK